MNLKVLSSSLNVGRKSMIIISEYDANELGVFPLEMVIVNHKGKELSAMVEIGIVGKGEALVTNELARILGIKSGAMINIRPRGEIKSKAFIRKKIDGKTLRYRELLEIVKDVRDRKLNDLEMAAFVTSLHIRGMSVAEAADLSMAMVEVGDKLRLKRKVIADKHSIGGVPGDKTSLLAIPIIASLGICIPKTSSRAITSPAGTADREEVIMENSLPLEKMREVVEKTGGCLVWGGALNLSPADDLFTNIERPLRLDPLFIPSILSKKKAVGATHLVLDIPTGDEAKVQTVSEASEIFRKFRAISSRIGIKIRGVSTFASQPLGRFIGAAPEAYEALSALIDPGFSPDLTEKAISVAGLLISMIRKVDYRKGKEMAKKQLESGKAYEKLKEIAEAQGPRATKPSDVKFGKFSEDMISDSSGFVAGISNKSIVRISRILGAPQIKSAGIELHKKIGDRVEKDERLMTMYTDSRHRMEEAIKAAEKMNIFRITQRPPGKHKMVLKVFG